MNKAISDVIRGLKLYHVWLYQAYYNLTSRYRRTIFGSMWIAANMVFTSVSLAILWGGLWGRPLQEVLPYCMSGNLIASIAFLLFYEGPDLFVGNAGMITNHAYPLTYFVFEKIAGKVLLFFHNWVIFIIFMLILKALVLPHWTIIPGFALLIICVLFWGNVIGMLAARFRDVSYLLPNLGHILYMITPVYWQYSMLKTNHWIADWNPLFAMISIVRMPLLGEAPSAANWQMALGFTALGAVAWLIFFSLYRRRIPFWV